MIFKFIYYIGSIIRNPELFKEFKFLKKSENWSRKELEKLQLNRLKEIVTIAYEGSHFYRSKFDEIGLDIKEINELDDLKKLPIINKSDLLKYSNKIQIFSKKDKLIYTETSGSTGEPLAWYRDRKWDTITRASQMRGYSWYGIKPWDFNGYLWGYNFEFKNILKIRLLDFLTNRTRLFSYDKKNLLVFIKKLERAKYLEGYSSMIYELAKLINSEHIKTKFNLQMIKGTSEKIFDFYQDEVYKAFGRKIISEYGSAESGLIAFECKSGNMHVNMENVIVETIENEIIVTNLVSKSFPIIRYRLGDFIKIDTITKCECGMQHIIVSDIFGRVGKVIQGNNLNYPSLTLYYIFKNLLKNYNLNLVYQAIQKIKGELILNFEFEITSESKNIILSECYKYFNNDVKIIINDKGIIRNFEEKYKDFVSYL